LDCLLRCAGMLSQRNKFLAVLALCFPAVAPAQNSYANSTAPADSEKPVANTLNKAGEIATQPVRDVGINKREIAEVLQRSADDPYATNTARTCAQISSAMRELNEVLGPDYEPGRTTRENPVGKLAEAGGKTVVNAFIPFRGLVREVTGAAPAERRYNAALDAGLVRRGFLRGLAVAKGCKLVTSSR